MSDDFDAEQQEKCRVSPSVFVIAEAGVNHNGSPEIAHRLVDVAAELGADAVKFQTFDAAATVAAGTATVTYQANATGLTDQQDMLRRLQLEPSVWRELADHCAEAGIEFMSTAFDLVSLELLLEIGVQRLKVPSGELTNLPFIRTVSAAGRPVIISTGMGTMDEVRVAARSAAEAPELCLLHCVSAYPAPTAEANLAVLPAMREATGCAVGWSDHCRGTTTVIAAVALGATVIERHLTLSNAMEGPDHSASDDPETFAQYMLAVRETWDALGDGNKQPTPSELETRVLARRSWHAARQLHRGDVIGPDDLVALRPATGVGPNVDLMGSTLERDVAPGQAVFPEHLAGFPPMEDVGL